MEATQLISDSILETDEENEEEEENKREQPLAKLCILKNAHIPEADLPLFLGDNVLGRDPNTCTLPLLAPSVSKQHATICLSVYHRRGCHSEVDIEALVWDLGSMNGTRKGRLKLTPNVRYALSDGDSLVVADIPCQYVSCAVDSSQLGPRTPVSRNSGVKSRLPDALGEKGGDKSTDSRKCVNSGTKAGVSSLKTPVRASCLSFEKTPTQPQGTLVPESDSDSDGERGGGGDRRRNALVSDSDSHKSSPTCSTFLSPTNKIVPESEDESPITPSSSTKNRPHRHVSFSKEETEVDVGGQLLEEKKALAIVHDSEEEGGGEEERAAPEGKSEKSGPHLPVKQESSASLTGEDELPVSTAAVSTDSIPAFNMDSDTDMEGEEEGVASVGSVTLNTNQVNQPPNTAQFHMDSDTDVDEDEDTIDKAPKTVPSSDDKIKPPHVNSFIQPEGVTVDSDTDVDDDAAVSDATTEAKPMSFQRANTADTASLMQPKDINLDSDTDVDEEEDRENGTNKPISKIEETPTRLDIKPTGPESSPAAPHSLHLDSDTDEEAIPVPALSEPVVVSAATESCTTADGGADILSDNDTDVDDNSPLVIPVVITTLSVAPGTISETLESDSNANTDVVGSSTPPAGDTANPQDLRVDSDVEDQEADGGQIPSLCREKTPGLLVPLLQNCSTPVHLSEGEVEVVETQAFLSPSSVPFRGAVAPVAGPVGLSSCSDSQEDEDFLVAETQSFILQTRDCQSNPPEDHTMDPTQAFGLEPSYENDEQSSREGSFQLGLSDSSHLQCQAQAVAMESTQAFVSVDRSVNMEDTQAYAAISTAVRTSAENDLNLEATQPYGKNEEPARCSVMSDKEGQVDLALEATQVYTSECHSDSESETDDDERKNITATAETQPFGFPTSCTPPVPHEEAAQPQQRPHGELLCTAETQPMSACDDEGSDDEDSIQSPGTRTAKPLQLEEQTQPLISSDLSIVETQPMHIGFAETQPMATSENEDTDDGDSIPIFRGRRAKPMQLEEEAQPLSGSEVSVTETQPMHIGGAETQPMGTCEGEQSDEEDSILVPRKRKARALQLEEEQTQPLTISEVSTVETQPLETQTGVQPERRRGRQPEAGTSGVNVRNKRGTMAGLREEEEQAACSELPKRRTRGKNKALTTTRGRRGKSNLDEDESEEEEEGEQARRARGKKSMRQQKHFEEEGEQCETEGSEHAENSSPIKEKQEEGSGEEGDVANLTHHKSEKMERKEKEEQDRLLAENTAKIRLEQERAEKERKEQEEKERYDRLQKEKEKKLEKERKEREEIERLEHEKAEREEKEKLEREEKERIEKERKEQEEKERLEKVKKELEERLERERKEQEHQARLEREAKEERERLEREAKEKEERERLEREAKERERLEKEKETKEKQIKEQQGNKDEVNSRVPTRGRRAATRTMAARSTTEPEQDSTILTNDDVPARRTRSRSNSSNSVSSERSAASVNTQEGRGRGRGRGKKRTSEPPQVTIARGNSRRRTVAAGTTEQGNNDAFPQGVLSRSNSTNSLNSDISSYTVTSQNRGRGSRQRERQRKTEPEPDSIPPVNSQSDQNSAPKPSARGRKSRKTEGSSNVAPQEDDQEKADSQQACTTRGQRRANANVSDSTAADEEDQPNQKEGVGSEESPLPKRNARGRGQKAVKSETAEAPVAPAVGNVGETKDKRKGRKRELQENTEGDSSSSSKISKGKEKYQTTEATEEEGKDESKEENPVQAKRRGRASTAQAKKNAKESPLGVEVKEESEEMEKDIVEKRGRGRPSAAQKKKKEEHDESGTSVSSMTRDAKVEAPEPQTPTTSASRKRQAPANSSPVAKSPRSSTASPAASGRQQAASQAYKVLFTGVVDETGERVLARLRGSIAKGVADMNCLVTDKVRRTVKFLCAVAKGIPIVTTHWLEKSGKAGSFLSPNAYVVKDPEQEKKFGFRLQESLRIASSQPLLQGYEIHVTKSVKPEPVQMKDIISCSGATFLPKMPSSPKPQTVVISCEEDWSMCGPAVAASLPVVTAEFILTGILQQKVDFQSHTLPAPVTNLQLTGGKGRGRKKT